MLQVGRVWAFEIDPFARSWVRKAKFNCVQPLAFERHLGGQNRIAAVERIPDTGVLYRTHVDANLVCSARLQLDPQQGGIPVRFEGVVVRDARPAVGANRELEVVLGVTRDRRVDRAGVRIRVALNERVIDLFDRSVTKRLLQHRVRPLRFSDHHQPTGADVEALDNSLPLRRARG